MKPRMHLLLMKKKGEGGPEIESKVSRSKIGKCKKNGAGDGRLASGAESPGTSAFVGAEKLTAESTLPDEKQPAAKQSHKTPVEDHQDAAVRNSEGSRATRKTTAAVPSGSQDQSCRDTPTVVESTQPDETWHALDSSEKEK